ncbi:MAG: PQQ-dependent sugar dehydrogenase [Candidatus Altiarchaeota archaeon]
MPSHPRVDRNDDGETHSPQIILPDGFEIHVYAENVTGARSMTLSPSGILYVGTRGEGKVYAIIDDDKDNKADQVFTVAEGLNSPNGLAFLDGSLYVAEISRIIAYEDLESDLANPPEPVAVRDDFPDDESHGWKFMRLGPDGLLYIPVGAPCNICEMPDERYSTIMRMSPGGVGLEVYASGVRNTVGFDWHPGTSELWFTDNGRDWLGDDMPPDELNHAPEMGLHFGFPYCHGGNITDLDFGSGVNCSEYRKPAQELGAHVASLGMRFYTGGMFPERYRRGIFIAEHGSWNSRTPVGYRVTFVELDGSTPVSYEPFAEGWLNGGTAWGRPVDVEVMPDGSLLVSDDKAGMIYRITYAGG